MSLTHIIDNVLELSQERFRIHCVNLDVDFEENLYIRCRETQVAQVLITLLNNAYNAVHTQREGWVKLSAKMKNGIISISIADSSERRDKSSINVVKGIIEENFGSIYYDHSSPHTKIVIEFPSVQVLT